MPMLRMREENFSGGGSIWGRGLLVSAISSMSKNSAPGNMLCEIFVARVPAVARHMPGGIEDDEVGRIELAGELLGLDQPGLGEIGHFAILTLDENGRSGRLLLASSQSGTGSPFSRRNSGLNSRL